MGVATLTTLRTQMRPFEPGDVETAFEVFGDAEVMRHCSTKVDATLDDARDRLARYAAHQVRYGFAQWAVFERPSGTYLGDAGIMISRETGELELRCRIVAHAWGRGLATEIAGAWLEHGIGTLGLPRVVGYCRPDHAAYIRVMDKIGMQLDGQARVGDAEVLVYARQGR